LGGSSHSSIGHLILVLHFPFSHSLKEKRFHLSGLKKKIQDRFHVSIAETGDMDLWQKSVLEVVYVSANRVQVEKTLSSVASFVASHPEIQVLDEIQEYI
jgi:hypothetical protein